MSATKLPAPGVGTVVTDEAPAPVGPYAQGVCASPDRRIVFVAGQLPIGKDGLCAADLASQMTTAGNNALAVLRSAGGDKADVVRAVVYTTALDRSEEINSGFRSLFGDHRPARTMVGVSALPLGAAVEIELTAAIPPDTAKDDLPAGSRSSVMTATDNRDTYPDLRQYTPAANSSVYLNTGTCGPLLAPVAEAMARAAQDEFLEGRIGLLSFQTFFETVGNLRQQLALLVDADADEIAVTHHTTEGMNIITWGLPWQPGDRVVTTTLEHGGALLPLYQLHHRLGVEVDFAPIGLGGVDETLEAISQALERPARLLILSHVAYGTGAVLPLGDIVSLAHERGVLVAADGAQSVGAIPVDVHESGIDFYAFPGQKWLCGPEGTGGLFVRRDHLQRLEPTFVGFFGANHDAYRADDPESLIPANGAARYEVGSLYRPGIYGLAEAARWHLGVGASHQIFEQIQQVAAHAIEAVSEFPGARLLTPIKDHAGLVSFDIADSDPAACVSFLYDHGVLIRSIPENQALRLSCGFFNSAEDVDHCLSLLRQHLAV